MDMSTDYYSWLDNLDHRNLETICTWQDLVDYVNEIGFLPLFSNEIAGFSAEEKVSSLYWWTGDPDRDPWVWREKIAASHQIAYGKFFGKRAGFISLEWLPCFANYRRNGYDFDARWEDGLASRREKKIMDLLTDQDEEGYYVWKTDQILSTDLKKKAGFGKNGEKNYPGVVTSLQMQTYLVIADFHRRVNRKGQEYGMPVSVYLPPEAIWGYDLVTHAYQEQPHDSWQKIHDRVQELFSEADEKSIVKVIGKEP